MKISIITSIYKGKKFINSLTQQLNENIALCKNIEFEYILINDYPLEKIENKDIKIQPKFEIKIINNEKNLGIHESRIKGVETSTGEYITFLDQDDTIEHNYFYSQIKCLKDDTDIVVANGWQKSEKTKTPIFFSQRHQREVLKYKWYIVRSPIISPGQCLIKKHSIPNEWFKNIIKNNGADDYFLWILMIFKNNNIVFNYNKIFNHCISDQNFSNNYDNMKKSSLEVANKLLNVKYVSKSFINKIKKMNNTKIGNAYGIKKSLAEAIKKPDVMLRLITYRLKLKLLGRKKSKNENNIKTFVTYLSGIQAIHLKKDVGALPIELNKKEDISASLLTYEVFEDVQNLAMCRYNMKLNIVDKITKNYFLNMFIYLKKHAKEIDIFNIYHIDRQAIFLSDIYKLFNRKGIVYIKADIDSIAIETLKNNIIKRKLMLGFFNRKKFLITVENIKNLSILKKLKLDNVKYLPNGFFKDDNTTILNKKNIILSVGRLGTEQKNTELLLESFKEFYKKNKDWKLQLVGSMEENFKEYYNNFLIENKDLKNAIEYMGEINNQKELFEIYSEAKIFALPSRWESFGIVLVEAIYKSCYIIGSSNIDSIEDVTNHQKYGRIVQEDTATKWSEVFNNVVEQVEFNDELYNAINMYALKYFDYEKIGNQLYNYLIELGE